MNNARLRWLTENLDYLRIPLNAVEREHVSGSVPYWGANKIVDYVDTALLDEKVVLIGEDGAPFYDPFKDVAFVSEGPIWPNNHIHVLRPDTSKISHEFLAYYLNQVDYSLYTNGSTRDKLTQFQLGSIVVRFPDVAHQAQITRFLDRETARIDGLIEKKARFIALLNEKEKAKISHLVRVGVDPDAKMIDAGVEWRGKVPTHWTRGRMKNHFRPQKRLGYETLTVLSVYREYGVIEKASRDDNINKTPEDLSKYQMVNPNDLVINKMKAWQGSMGIAGMQGITSPDYVVMEPVGEHDPRYMHHYLRARPMPWLYRLISNGIRTDQWRLEPEKFLILPIFLPPLEEQRAIADEIDRELDRIRNLIAKTEQSIALLKEKRAALITAAVTGKIDARSAA
ncbi:restriction endonuclease subunit S [Roseovarius sp. A21]|uniref:Restriction endonuclease subunit S n=1 Tax=Roseovarius bejariae TaxID=2576383 RepID=A0A844CY89_9RHOB|nr:restriction endonuclease subunit S [Roseovarius bejariae]MRU17069.1 restriction endonuclease subunit S [Roseovarius bejariae]